MGVFQQSELGLRLVQAGLGRLEFDEQFRHRRKQPVEQALHLIQVLKAVFDFLELRAQRLVLHADRFERCILRIAQRRRARGGRRADRVLLSHRAVEGLNEIDDLIPERAH